LPALALASDVAGMNNIAREKAKQTQRRNQQKWASQTIKVDSEWEIRREDELNWGIWHKGKTKNWYYPSIPAALTALPLKMLNEEAKGTLKTVLSIQKGIVDRIENAFAL
jgi:hypothetical protein